MENAVDALKMAFAVIVFVMALSISIYMFSEARATADLIIHRSDLTRYMEYQEAEDTENRIVGLETIVPTLYKYYKENYTVVFRYNNGNFMPIYDTKMTDTNLWGTNYLYKSYGTLEQHKICSFDVNEETSRHEPWTGSTEHYKDNLDAFLSGRKFYFPSGRLDDNGDRMFYEYENFMDKYKNKKFIENLGEYSYNEGNTNDVKIKKKRVIIYTLYN